MSDLAHRIITYILLLVVIAVGALCLWHIIELKNKPAATTAPPVINVTTTGDPAKPGDPQVVYVQGTNTVTHEISYVPKATDPTTGQKELTDVQIDQTAKYLYVQVNGKMYQFPITVQENSTFQNGKLQIEETYQSNINLTTPKPFMNLGVGYGRNGIAMEANGPLFKSVSWWGYGDKKTFAGGLQFPISK